MRSEKSDVKNKKCAKVLSNIIKTLEIGLLINSLNRVKTLLT